MTVEKGKEWILWNEPRKGKGKGSGAGGMRLLIGGSAPVMVKFLNRATRRKVAVAEYYHARKHQPTMGIDGVLREGGEWGQRCCNCVRTWHRRM